MKQVRTIMKAVDAFLDADDKLLRGDARIYTAEEWRARGEEYGLDSLFTLVIDGSPMYDALNYGSYGWGTSERFSKMLAELGCWYEMGYAWTVHVYRKE